MKKSKLVTLSLLAFVAYLLPHSIQAQDKEAEKLLSESSKQKQNLSKQILLWLLFLSHPMDMSFFQKLAKVALL
jgi:hypothetical protein